MLALLILGGINAVLSGLILWQVAQILIEISKLSDAFLSLRDMNEVCLQKRKEFLNDTI